MKIVNLKSILTKAQKEHYAVLHTNVINFDIARTVINTANKTKSPLIVAVSEKALKGFAGTNDFAQMIKGIVIHDKITVPIVIHLDHGKYDTVLSAIKSGFTSVMYDGSTLPLKENIANTKKILALAKKKNISVEVELGAITGKVEDRGAVAQCANVNDCKLMAAIGIDALAIGIGNLHGKYPKNWSGLNFERLKDIQKAIPKMPLVLHGGSGIPTDQIKKSIDLGICKFNIGTELLTAFTEELSKYFKNGNDKKDHGYDPRNYFPLGLEQTSKVVIEKLKMLGSYGKA